MIDRPVMPDRCSILLVVIDEQPAAQLYLVPGADIRNLLVQWLGSLKWTGRLVPLDDNLWQINYTTAEGITGTAYASRFLATRH